MDRNLIISLDIIKYLYKKNYSVYVSKSINLDKILKKYISNIEETPYIKNTEISDLYGDLISTEIKFSISQEDVINLDIEDIYIPIKYDLNELPYYHLLNDKFIENLSINTLIMIILEIVINKLEYRVNNNKTNIDLCKTVFKNYISLI